MRRFARRARTMPVLEAALRTRGGVHGHRQRSRPGRDAGMDRLPAGRRPLPGRRARALSPFAAARRGRPRRCAAVVHADHALSQYHSSRARGGVPGKPRDRASHPLGHSLERRRDHPAREQGVVRARRAHRELPVVGAPVRHRVRALLACAFRRSRRRSSLRSGTRLAGHLRPRVRRGPAHRAAAPQFPAGSGGSWNSVVSPSVAHAGLLAVPHGVDGPGSAHGHLPGALPQVPRGPRPREDREPQGVGVPGRRRMRRARVARRHLARGPRAPRQPRVRHQLQPAAPRRPGARQRQDHPGSSRASSAARDGTSSRSCGARAGTSFSRRTRKASS